jgi:ABC-2 type transport system permease protein
VVWKLLRARLWALRHAWQGLAPGWRAVALGLAGCLGGGGAWAYGRMVAGLRQVGDLSILTGVVPNALMILLFITLLSLADTLRRLYLDSDLALLLAAPVWSAALYGAKTIECSQSLWLPAIVLGVVLAAVGQAQGAPAWYYPLTVGLLVALVASLTVVGMMLVTVVARLIPPGRLRGWLPVLLAVASLGGIVMQQALMSQGWRWLPVLAGLEAVTGDAARMATVAGAGVAAAGLLAVAGYGVFDAAFYRRWTDFRGGSMAPGRRRAGLAELIRQRVSTPAGIMLAKDVTLLFREPGQLAGLAIVPLVMIVLLLPLISGDGALRALNFWLLLLYGGMFGVNSVQGAGLTAWAREGRNFWLLRIAPFSLRAAFWAKFWGQWLPTASVWALAYLAVGLVAGLPAWQTGLLVVTLALGLAAGTGVTVALGALGTDPDRAEESQRVGGVYAWLGLGLAALFLGLSMAMVALLVPHLAPESELVQASVSALLAVAPRAGWISGTQGLIAAGVVALAQGVYLLGTWRLWTVAVRHLQGCEIV